MKTRISTSGMDRFGRGTLRRLAFASAFALGTFAASPAIAGDSLVIRDFTLTHGIADREPMDKIEAFESNDEKGYAFVRIANDGPPTAVTVVWSYEGKRHASLDLNIGTSNGWRTWSSSNLKQGDWKVELVDANGVVLVQRDFTVGASMAKAHPAVDRMDGGDRFQQLSEDPAIAPLFDSESMRDKRMTPSDG